MPVVQPQELYKGFVDDNMTKRYPLLDTATAVSTSGNVLPNSFIADIKLSIGLVDREGDNSYRYNLYISSIRVYSDYAYVTISDAVSGDTVAVSQGIPLTLTSGSSVSSRTIVFNPTGDIPINGTMIVGTAVDMAKQVGINEYTIEATQLFPCNIFPLMSALTGIYINGTYITGDVTIKEGDNIVLSYDETSNTITIGVVTADDSPITSNDALLDAVTAKYGQPMTSLNGILPDAEGNVDIIAADCLDVVTDGTNHTISFSNPCGTTCASDEFMKDTYIRIADLNKNFSVLRNFYTSVSGVLSQMSARVSSVLNVS